jgi:hypothetical protein
MLRMKEMSFENTLDLVICTSDKHEQAFEIALQRAQGENTSI